jgi:spoIIIJ-associated protein
MFEKRITNKIKKFTEEFFKRASFDVQVTVEEIVDSTVRISINLSEPQVLIGENGKTLGHVQHILSKVIKKKIDKDLFVDLDINDYKAKKISYLKELAKSYADDVALTGQPKEFRPMSGYERRIIHLELQDRTDVLTESAGQDPDRKIVVKPA